MADLKISQLTAKGTTIAATDLIEISESDGAGGYITKSVTGANIIDSKQDTLISGTNIKTIEGQSILGGGNINITNTDVGLGNVDNTSDLNKPISTATQTALNAKQNTITNSDSITQGVTNLFLTTGERTKLTNTSGVNTGDQTNITGTAANVTGIVAVANGGTGTATPSLVAGTNVTITGTFPNQTIAASGGGGGSSTGLQSAVYSSLFSFRTSNALTASSATNHSLSSASMQYVPYIPNTTFTCVEFSINVITAQATGLARICVYSSSNNEPTNLLYSSTDLDCSTTGAKSVISSFVFTQGTIYWLGIQTNVNNISFTGLQSTSCIPLSCTVSGTQITSCSQTGLTYASGAPSVASITTFISSSSIQITMKK